MKKIYLFTLSFFALFLYSNLYSQTSELIYISDAGNWSSPPWQILKYNVDGTGGELFTNEEMGWPQDILFLEDENVALISNLNTNRINRHDATTGEFLSIFATIPGGPTRMKIGKDSLLYVVLWSGTRKVARFELDGTMVDEYTSAGVNAAIGLDWDENDNLYVSSYSGNVRKFDSLGIDSGLFISSNLAGPTNIWFDKTGTGDLIVNDYNANSVKRFDSAGNFLGVWASGNGLSQPEGVEFLPNGNVLIGSSGNGMVKMYDSLGNFISTIIDGSDTLNLMRPNAIRYRVVTTTSLNKPLVQQNIVSPNFGRRFKINSSLFNRNKPIYLSDVNGRTIAEYSSESQFIQAQELKPGIFFIRTLIDNNIYRQKIFITD